MEVNAHEDSFEAVKAFVHATFEGAVLEEFYGGRLKFRLPAQADMSLSALFGAVEQEKARCAPHHRQFTTLQFESVCSRGHLPGCE